MVERAERDKWLAADEAALLADCAVDAYRSGGPGGQHRNKNSTAIRLRHLPTGLIVIAEDSRSQHENKQRAIRRMRMAIALECRSPVEPGWTPGEEFLAARTKAGRVEVSVRNPVYPIVVATILDAVASTNGSLREAGGLLGLATAQLSRAITGDGKLLDAVNRIRRAAGHRPITRD